MSDEQGDDFGVASQHVEADRIDDTYHYRHRNPAWRLASWLLYYVVAPPVAWVIRQVYGIRLVGRERLRGLGGCFLYGNHTHWTDAIVPFALAFPRRAYIVVGPTAVSIPGVRHLVAMMGGLPLNTTPAGKAAFRARLAAIIAHGDFVFVYPEAHTWPYYNGIRHFSERSFSYPVRASAPVAGFVVTYHKRRWARWRSPRRTVSVQHPLLPAAWAGEEDPKTYLRDQVYGFMLQTIAELGSDAFAKYVPPED